MLRLAPLPSSHPILHVRETMDHSARADLHRFRKVPFADCPVHGRLVHVSQSGHVLRRELLLSVVKGHCLLVCPRNCKRRDDDSWLALFIANHRTHLNTKTTGLKMQVRTHSVHGSILLFDPRREHSFVPIAYLVSPPRRRDCQGWSHFAATRRAWP